jgi:hypothetical protein
LSCGARSGFKIGRELAKIGDGLVEGFSCGEIKIFSNAYKIVSSPKSGKFGEKYLQLNPN